MRDVQTWTKSAISCAGYLHASDPEGDELRYEITEYPAKGLVTLDSAAGKYEYTPYSGASGTDSFSYRACDSYGNYSAESAVSLKIEKSDSEIVFSDMAGYPGYARGGQPCLRRNNGRKGGCRERNAL